MSRLDFLLFEVFLWEVSAVCKLFDSFLLIKSWELKIGLAYSLLYYDILTC